MEYSDDEERLSVFVNEGIVSSIDVFSELSLTFKKLGTSYCYL